MEKENELERGLKKYQNLVGLIGKKRNEKLNLVSTKKEKNEVNNHFNKVHKYINQRYYNFLGKFYKERSKLDFFQEDYKNYTGSNFPDKEKANELKIFESVHYTKHETKSPFKDLDYIESRTN